MNTYAERNRAIKAARITEILIVAHDRHLEDALVCAELISSEPSLEHYRRLVGDAAGVHPPSVETMEIVCIQLRARVAVAAAPEGDPFACFQ